MTIAQCLMPLVDKLAGGNATASHTVAASNATAHASFQDVQGAHQQAHPVETACWCPEMSI